MAEEMDRMDESSNIREWILNVSSYSEHEKSRVEQFVLQHPEWRDALREAQSWDQLLTHARAMNDPQNDASTLPFFLASDVCGHHLEPKALEAARHRFEKRLDKNEALQEQKARMLGRFNDRESEADVIAHFETVTQNSHELGRPRSYVESPMKQRDLIEIGQGLFLRIVPRLGKSITFLLAGYLILFFASWMYQSPLERIAHLSNSDFEWTELGVSTRGNDSIWEGEMVRRYDMALSEAKESSRSFLGLFPSYRMDRLQGARMLLEEAIEMQQKRDSVPAAAYLTLAKIRFLLGDRVESLEALGSALQTDINPGRLPSDKRWFD